MSRRKRSKKSDPHRNERIRIMLQDEKERRELLESTNRMAKDLSHWAHYDKVQKSKAASALLLVAEMKERMEHCLEIAGKCAVIESDLNTERQNLQSELEMLQGKMMKADPQATIKQLMRILPPEQANALYSVMELGRIRILSTSLEEEKELGNSFDELLRTLENKFASIKEESNDIDMILQKKVERGWVSNSQLPEFGPIAEGNFRGIEEALKNYRDYLVNWRTRCESVRKGIEELKSAIKQLRKNDGYSRTSSFSTQVYCLH